MKNFRFWHLDWRVSEPTFRALRERSERRTSQQAQRSERQRAERRSRAAAAPAKYTWNNEIAVARSGELSFITTEDVCKKPQALRLKLAAEMSQNFGTWADL